MALSIVTRHDTHALLYSLNTCARAAGCSAMIAPRHVLMLRPSLDDLPQYVSPHPFTIRWYQEGDAQHGLAMKAQSDHVHQADLTYYLNTYGAHARLLPQRQAFLCDRAAQPIGTTTAWFEDFAGQHDGKVN